jgi:hypothetical protein
MFLIFLRVVLQAAFSAHQSQHVEAYNLEITSTPHTPWRETSYKETPGFENDNRRYGGGSARWGEWRSGDSGGGEWERMRGPPLALIAGSECPSLYQGQVFPHRHSFLQFIFTITAKNRPKEIGRDWRVQG